MGAGLFYDKEGKTVYFEPFEGISHEGDESEIRFQHEDAWADAMFNLKSSLPEGFTPVEKGAWGPAGRVVAENNKHQICVLEDEGGYGYVFLTVRPLEIDECDAEQEALAVWARDTLDEVASGFFDKLHESQVLGELRVRDTPWTSSPYEPGEKVRMAM